MRGGNGLVDGPALPENLEKVMKKIADQGFAHKLQVLDLWVWISASTVILYFHFLV